MSDIAIRVEHLSKRYRLGEREPYKSLRDVIARAAAAPASWLSRKGQPAVAKGSGYFWALEDVSLEIRQGEAVGIIGRNGAGKSTLLKILSRITKPTKGQAQIYGRVGSLLEVGTGFHPELTGRENIFLNGAILGMKRKEIERKFDEIVAFAEIEKFLDTPVKRYSSGMYVRLAFAVAAHLEPEILIVDEVLAVGDAQFQKKCLGKMGEVAGQGRTVIFVSHNMGVIQELCTKAILLDYGKVRMESNTHDVVSAYLEKIEATQSTKSWNIKDAPGTNKLNLLSIKVMDRSGEPRQIFRSDEIIKIELGYQINMPIKDARIGIRVYGANNMCLFTSTDCDNEFTSEQDRDAGKYISNCYIPGNLLNSGEFQVNVVADIPMREFLINSDHLVSFKIELVGGVGTRYSDNRLGYIRPRLEWQTYRIDHQG